MYTYIDAYIYIYIIFMYNIDIHVWYGKSKASADWSEKNFDSAPIQISRDGNGHGIQ